MGQIENKEEERIMYEMMRGMQDNSLVCGVVGCGVRGKAGLTVCNGCKVQRYCGREHQKKDWKWHKLICAKGLVEPEVEDGDGVE